LHLPYSGVKYEEDAGAGVVPELRGTTSSAGELPFADVVVVVFSTSTTVLFPSSLFEEDSIKGLLAPSLSVMREWFSLCINQPPPSL